jgi:hypothetical protein
VPARARPPCQGPRDERSGGAGGGAVGERSRWLRRSAEAAAVVTATVRRWASVRGSCGGAGDLREGGGKRENRETVEGSESV